MVGVLISCRLAGLIVLESQLEVGFGLLCCVGARILMKTAFSNIEVRIEWPTGGIL